METERDTKRIKLEDNRSSDVQTIKISALLDKKPEISQPLEVASFGFDEQNNRVHEGKKLLRKYNKPALPVDLNEGFDTYVPKDNSATNKLSFVLDTIKESKLSTEGISIISYRNNFNKILETPFSKEMWSIDISKVNGVLLFEIVDLKKGQESNDLMTYYGYKFEEVCTHAREETNGAVNPNVQFCSVVKTKLGQHRLLIAAEMDCYDGNDAKLENYIEIKTYKLIDSDRVNYTWQRYKLLKFWIQSFFVGVRTIVCGYRDNKGHVQKIEKINTKDIPSMGRKYWDSWQCLSFADGLISWIKNNIKEENVTYRLHYGGRDSVSLTLVKNDTKE